MGFGFLDAWDDYLPTEGGHVVALCGGGGKTSLLACAAAALRARGARVAVTTTTRTEPLAWPGLRTREWDELVAGAPGNDALLFVRRGAHPDGKWRGLAPDEVDALGELLPGHVVLVEADGSAGRPVKLHREDEPVWPGRTSLAVVVMGLGAVGLPIGEALHRHGRLPSPHLPADPAAPWDWEMMFRLLAGPGGYLARVPAGRPVVVALTQLGACVDGPGLFAFIGRVMGEANVPLVTLGELAGEHPGLRTAWRVGPDGPRDDAHGDDASDEPA